MTAPDDRRYLPTHEWHRLEGQEVTIGISQFAADELTDITFVSLPAVGQTLEAGKAFGEIESVKATAELLSGVGGEVLAVNAALVENPGLVNSDPYSGGWMIRVRLGDRAEYDRLLSAQQYGQK